MNIKMNEDPFAKNARGISKILYQVFFIMKFIQTKPQIKNMNSNYYDLYYTLIKNREEEEILDNQHENDYTNINDNTHNHKPRETILRWVENFKILYKSIQVILTI